MRLLGKNERRACASDAYAGRKVVYELALGELEVPARGEAQPPHGLDRGEDASPSALLGVVGGVEEELEGPPAPASMLVSGANQAVILSGSIEALHTSSEGAAMEISILKGSKVYRFKVSFLTTLRDFHTMIRRLV